MINRPSKPKNTCVRSVGSEALIHPSLRGSKLAARTMSAGSSFISMIFDYAPRTDPLDIGILDVPIRCFSIFDVSKLSVEETRCLPTGTRVNSE